MIDTDKYEGHSPQEKWHIDESSVGMGKGFVGSLCLCELCQDEVYLEGSNERELCDEVKANLRLMADAPLLLAEVERLQKKVKKLNWVLCELDGMIMNYDSHVELMKVLEQGLELPETWKGMIE